MKPIGAMFPNGSDHGTSAREWWVLESLRVFHLTRIENWKTLTTGGAGRTSMLSFIAGMVSGVIGVAVLLVVLCGMAICSAQKRFESDWRIDR